MRLFKHISQTSQFPHVEKLDKLKASMSLKNFLMLS